MQFSGKIGQNKEVDAQTFKVGAHLLENPGSTHVYTSFSAIYSTNYKSNKAFSVIVLFYINLSDIIG